MKGALITSLLVLLHNTAAMANTFKYFAYGSNLLANRIHVNNPTAVRKGIGKLENYHLDFISFVKYWNGAIATIVPAPGEIVWGAIWEISLTDLPRLDKQEGRAYIALDVEVILPDGNKTKCRTYQHTTLPEKRVDLKFLPENRRPSWIYLKTIIKGAEESGLPQDYQSFLKNISHNGYANDDHIGFKLSC